MERCPVVKPDDITVVLPTRNEERNILPFLGTLPPAVSLIVVDASDDHTPRLVQTVRPRRTAVLRSRARIAVARNLGAQAATTPWLLFTDADVGFAPDYFERVRTHGAAAALYGPRLSEHAFQRYYRWFARGQRLLSGIGIPAVSGSNFLVRRSVFLATGGFDPALSCNEDSEYGWRLARDGYTVTFAPDLIVYERGHRRLQRGATNKTIHSLMRCSLLFSGLMPERLRPGDWGYWS